MGRNMERTHIWVIGGDRRQSILAGLLRDDGHRVHTLGLGEEEAEGPDLDGIGGELEIPSPESMELLWDAVRRKGFSERQAELFMRGNAKRVIGAVLG